LPVAELPFAVAVTLQACVPSSADVTARDNTSWEPETLTRLDGLALSDPANCEPSDVATEIAAIAVPPVELSFTVGAGGFNDTLVGWGSAVPPPLLSHPAKPDGIANTNGPDVFRVATSAVPRPAHIGITAPLIPNELPPEPVAGLSVLALFHVDPSFVAQMSRFVTSTAKPIVWLVLELSKRLTCP
jgi:hypothetical protein